MRTYQHSLELDLVGDTKDDWTHQGAETRSLTHCYHDYPARMIPQVAGRLLDLFAPKPPALLFDPYCGTGTSLVEGMLRGLNVIGTDINPLARLIARAKTTLLPVESIDRHLAQLLRHIHSSEGEEFPDTSVEGINRLEFWFKPEILDKLAHLRAFVRSIEVPEVRDFFSVAFSETVREASNTRRDEFKLYRYTEADLERHLPNPYALMSEKLSRNRLGLLAFHEAMRGARPTSNLYDFNTVLEVPSQLLPPSSVDLVVTSPPYGDSQTTVAYGQYSRLSSAWLGLPNVAQVDRTLMGGRAKKVLPQFPSDDLNDALASIAQREKSRALEVASFYCDLYDSIRHIAPLIRSGGYVCYVVGNRTVKGVVLPTDRAIRHFFEAVGFVYENTFHRAIPNKRMPSRNSPTNAQGKTEQTMLCEYIVILKRP